MKKYLVTGGAGFIGANFVKYIAGRYGRECEIVILDKLTYAGHVENIAEELKLPNVRLVVGDICDRNLVETLLDSFDPNYIVNFAAESHVDRSISDPRPFLETNIMGTQNLLECARNAWATPEERFTNGKFFLQISTDEVYGSLERTLETPVPLILDGAAGLVANGRSDMKTFGEGLFTEDTPLAPRSPYSASKASADMMTLAYSHTYGFPAAVTRCSNNYGPLQFPEKLIPRTISRILAGEKIPVFAQGKNVRDWLYVEDHCRAIDDVLTYGHAGEIFNIGGFNEEQNIDVVRRIINSMRSLVKSDKRYRELSALPPEKIDYSLIEFVKDRPGHDMRYAIDPSKIATTLSWTPSTPFETGILKTVKWCMDNTSWAKAVTEGTEDFL